jgi:hypothetical protein
MAQGLQDVLQYPFVYHISFIYHLFHRFYVFSNVYEVFLHKQTKKAILFIHRFLFLFFNALSVW